MPKTLGKELAAFESHRADWFRTHEGKWVVIRGGQVLGFYEKYVEAWEAADEAYGEPGFLVKQVTASDEPIVVSHLHVPEPTGRSTG